MPNRDGFTLIELLLVIVIVGVLIAIATPHLWSTKDHAQLTAVYNDLKAFAVHQEIYHATHFTYADDPGVLEDFERTVGVEIEVTYAQPVGWLATGRHVGLTNECMMFVGSVPSLDDPPLPLREGVAECD